MAKPPRPRLSIGFNVWGDETIRDYDVGAYEKLTDDIEGLHHNWPAAQEGLGSQISHSVSTLRQRYHEKNDPNETGKVLAVSIRSRGKLALTSLNIQDMDVEGSVFDKTDLRHLNLNNCVLRNVEFRNCNLADANFKSVEFDEVQFIQCMANASTAFSEVINPENITMDRITLERMGPNKGGLNNDDLSRINLIDDSATFRSFFIGFRRIQFYLAMLLFWLPYIVFLAKLWAIHVFKPQGDVEVTLLGALFRYIVNGGKNWQIKVDPDWSALIIFVLMLMYNGLRCILAWKAGNLDAREKAFKVPARFSFSDKPRFVWNPPKWLGWLTAKIGIKPWKIDVCFRVTWGRLFAIVRLGLLIMVVIAILNAIKFMLLTVSVEDIY